MPSRLTKKEKLKAEIVRNVLLSLKEKEYWLLKLKNLPSKMVDTLLKEFQKTNRQVDKYIKKALQEDPHHNHLSALRAEMRKMKQGVQGVEHKKEETTAEAELEQQLKQIDPS